MPLLGRSRSTRVFNPLSAGELVSALGVPLRETAGREGTNSPFERAQLFAGSTVAKYLTAELEHGAEVVAWLSDALAVELERAGIVEPAAQALMSRNIHDLAEVFGALFADRDDRVVALRPRLHALLRELSDREMEVLSRAG